MTFPYMWRITKYNPALRNLQGHYLAEDWIAISDIGRFFTGKQLTYEDYFSCESAYASSVLSFLSEAGLSSLRVTELENHYVADVKVERLRDIVFQPALLKAGSIVGGRDLEDIIRLILREVLWCKLIETNKFYVHFGWDYYMYIGSMVPSYAAIRHAELRGLFVEEMASPRL
jgi:hypothetical protein